MRKFLSILTMMMLTVSVFAHFPDASESDMAPHFLKEFKVYPNPSTGAVTLTLETLSETSAPLQLRVYSLIGQEMHTEMLSPFSGVKKMQLDLTKFPKGIYLLEISNGDKSRIKRLSVI